MQKNFIRNTICMTAIVMSMVMTRFLIHLKSTVEESLRIPIIQASMPYACAGLLGFLLFCYAIVGVLFHHCVTFLSEAGVYFANSFPQSQSSSYMQDLPLHPA